MASKYEATEDVVERASSSSSCTYPPWKLGLLPLNRAMTATGPAATALRRAAIGRPSVHRVPPGLERLGVAAKFDFGERLGNLDSPPRQEPSCSAQTVR